jgi:ribosomal protein S14
MMIRTVWLAAACLAVLGAMVAGKVAEAPAAQTTNEEPLAVTTVDADLVQEPLTKADRLEVTYLRQEKPSSSTVEPIDPIMPEVRETTSPAETQIVSRHWHDPNATSSSAKNSKRTANKGKSSADSKDNQTTDRSKPNEQTRRCDRTTVLSGVLRSLKLAPACDS